MKKFILGLGSLASAVAPIAAVVACGTDSNGLPTLNAVESTKIVTKFASVLGITMPSQNDAFQIKFSKLDKSGMTFTLERTDKNSSADLTIANLEKTAGTALAMSAGEMLEFNFGFNTDMTSITSQKYTLSGAKTATKNGVYTAKTGTLTSALLMPVINEVMDELNGYKSTILSSTEITSIKNTLGTSAISAAVIFADSAMAQGPATYTPSLNNINAELKSKVTPSGEFDFTLTLTAKTGGFIIMSEDKTKWLTVAATKVAKVHLMGALGSDGHYTLSKKEASFEGTKVTLNDAGAKLLATALNVIAAPKKAA